jgi:hypothetical protein
MDALMLSGRTGTRENTMVRDDVVALLVPAVLTFCAIGMALVFVPQKRMVECEVSLPAPIFGEGCGDWEGGGL